MAVHPAVPRPAGLTSWNEAEQLADLVGVIRAGQLITTSSRARPPAAEPGNAAADQCSAHSASYQHALASTAARRLGSTPAEATGALTAA